MCNCERCQLIAEVVAVAMIRWCEHLPDTWEGSLEEAWAGIVPFMIVTPPDDLDGATHLAMAADLKGMMIAAAGISGGLYPQQGRIRLTREPRQRLTRLKHTDFSSVLDAAMAVLRDKEGERSHETT